MRLAEQANKALKLLNEYYDKAITDKARQQIEAMSLHVNGFAQPGFDDKHQAIVMGNFSAVTAFDYSLGFTVEKDSTPFEVGSELTSIGVSLISDNGWIPCNECMRLFLHSPEGENKYFWDSGKGIICQICVKQNPRHYLKFLNGQYVKKLIDVNLKNSNYWSVGSYYSTGSYSFDGMKIALQQHGISNFFFKNFTVTNESFQIWVDGEEIKKIDFTHYVNSMTGHLAETKAVMTKAEVEKEQQ